MISAALLCLALNVYYEAKGEPIHGQYAVAYVTINRVLHPEFPDDICKVVYQPYQFSWTHSKNLKPRGEQWQLAQTIAREVLAAESDGDITKGATHFHNISVKPHWSRELKRTLRVGRHIFYKAS